MKVECIDSSIVGEIEILAPPETVWEALTSAEQQSEWWGGQMYRTYDRVVDLRPGGAWSCQCSLPDGTNQTSVHGHYLEVDYPHALGYTWNHTWDPINETQVHFTLLPIEGGTLLQMHHDGFAGYEKSQQSHGAGWKAVLGWLSNFCIAKGKQS